MNQDKLQEPTRTGPPALKADGRVAATEGAVFRQSATGPALKSPVGNAVTEAWSVRSDRVVQEAGGERPQLRSRRG